MQKYNAIFCVNKSIQMQLSFCHFSLCLLYSMQLKFYFKLGWRVFNVKSIIIISSHWWMFSSWYECIFSVSFPHNFKFLILYYVRPILSLFKRRKRHFLEFIFQDPELCFTIASIQVDINPSFDSLFLKCCLIIMFHY